MARILALSPALAACEIAIMKTLRDALLAITRAVILSTVTSVAAAQSPLFEPDLNQPGRPLRGLVDMHTHPMAHLGFGGHLVHGAPYVGALIPAGQLYSSAGSLFNGRPNCNPAPVRAVSIQEALGSCRATHGGHNLDGNNCGNHVRRFVLDQFENGKSTNKPHDVDHPDGYPFFSRWPRHDDVLHQQMWIDWVRRAYAGGLRVMVSLAVHSYTFARGIDGNQPLDDRSAGDLQLDELGDMVQRHSGWMEIARSAADLRRIVSQDRLAIVLGVELDDIGSFMLRRLGEPTPSEVRAEIDRLHAKGVRYIFPVHVVDNFFGGAAVYESDFAVANRVHFGSFFGLGCAASTDGITRRLSNDLVSPFKGLLSGIGTDTQPIPACPDSRGHVNVRGLQALGRVALSAMMSKGMLIDLDHMSQRTVADVLAFHASYPFVSGHNGLRGSGADVNENSRTAAQYAQIAARGGIAGVGIAEATALSFADEASQVVNTGVSVALGSDINGLVRLPGPPIALSGTRLPADPRFPVLVTGARVWDYNNDGVAHIGLLPEFLRDVELTGDRMGRHGSSLVRYLFGAAEAFARTWERAEIIAPSLVAAPATFTKIIATVHTTTDDIRGSVLGSGVARAWISVQLRTRDLPAVEVTSMPKGANASASFEIPTGVGIRVEDVVSLTVRHESNDCFLCDRDYWNAYVELEGPRGEFILRTPEFRIGHQTRVFRR